MKDTGPSAQEVCFFLGVSNNGFAEFQGGKKLQVLQVSRLVVDMPQSHSNHMSALVGPDFNFASITFLSTSQGTPLQNCFIFSSATFFPSGFYLPAPPKLKASCNGTRVPYSFQ